MDKQVHGERKALRSTQMSRQVQAPITESPSQYVCTVIRIATAVVHVGRARALEREIKFIVCENSPLNCDVLRYRMLCY